ncbi:hypothetical protein [Fusibacter ferrireducens]|uniref:Flagellar FliJ protein n=1 Tax=Fusibacter ferrireducens TaxID=2785058 RepID=A0ABR9ZVK2_9FIRM|nr:hypothetical protein [Fusibacter ferrireducens]MBF4694495.1 hypothetical protein [Fusibacter ferrireducens]
MNDFKGIEQLETVIEEKRVLIRKLLRLQLEVLECSETDYDVNLMKEHILKCHQMEKDCFNLDILFLRNYQKLLETEGVSTLESIDKSLLKGFKKIKQDVAEILSLEEHLKIQSTLINQIEVNLLKQEKNRLNLDRYRLNQHISKSKKE